MIAHVIASLCIIHDLHNGHEVSNRDKCYWIMRSSAAFS